MWVSVLATGGLAARPLELDDFYRIASASDPRMSPDGRFVAYTVTRTDRAADRETSDIWQVTYDGSEQRQLTFSESSESRPRFSPDGRYLAFLSDRKQPAGTKDDARTQVWLLDRRGGEARRLTQLAGGVSDYAWSPDARRLVVVAEVDPSAAEDEDELRPIVVDRLQFKKDETGYLGAARQHLFLVDVESGAATPLAGGPFDALAPAWSPDGKSIAFLSKRGADPDAHDNWDVYRLEPHADAVAVQVTSNPGQDGDPEESWGESAPAFSPDGTRIAYVHGGPPEHIWYALVQVGMVPAAGGTAELPAADLDRNVFSPRFSPDGRSLYFLLEDDRSVLLARVRLRDGVIERLTPRGSVVTAYDVGADGRVVLVSGTSDQPREVHALEGGKLRTLSTHTRKWRAEVDLARAEEVSFRSGDGLEIRGLMLRPAVAGLRPPFPAWLNLHGGPVGQHQHAFDFEAQLFAARGYVVLLPNPRGSSGRGFGFQHSLFGEWGFVDVPDVLAAVDHAVAAGIADPARLVVGGWSYGAILTNYVIASDRRFKAAISGAGMSNMLGGYGIDHYVREWELELGLPWEHTEQWLRLSYPFLNADRIVTPTLFMCGAADFNVPLQASEQMYQALRRLGVPTQLVIYPEQHHSFAKVSFQLDAWRRYLEWFERFL